MFLKVLVEKFVIKLIELYQKTLSFDHGFFKFMYPYGYCRFQPSCSQYTIDAIKKKGLIKGLLMGIKRILRCNPWNKGGHDPVK